MNGLPKYAYLVMGASGKYDDFATWPVCVTTLAPIAERVCAEANREMGAALAAEAAGAEWVDIAAMLKTDPRADVDKSTYYTVKPVPRASGIEAPSGGETGTGSTEGESPTAEGGDAQ